MWFDEIESKLADIAQLVRERQERLDQIERERQEQRDQIDGELWERLDQVPANELELSVRTSNCLKNSEILYLGDLVQMSEQEMLRIPNFGRKSLQELKEFLAAYGLHFGMHGGDLRKKITLDRYMAALLPRPAPIAAPVASPQRPAPKPPAPKPPAPKQPAPKQPKARPSPVREGYEALYRYRAAWAAAGKPAEFPSLDDWQAGTGEQDPSP